MANKMDDTLEKENPPSEVNVSNEAGIRLRLRDRDLLKKRKAEAEEKATNQEQSLKRAKKWSSASGTPGRKGRPRKQPPVVVSEDFSVVQETDPPSITPPVLPTEAETATPQPAPVSVETIKEKTLKTFFIEDLGPDEEEDMPLSQKRLVIDSDIGEPRTDVPEQIQISVPAFAPATAPSYPESLPENVPEPLI
ncbi:putative hemogen [Triplophysa rosa]|uniref:Hemogen n=1 Tax=Triplophysa rosa TaxID=992332 RepID=A0A9W7WYA1_TRIRA|nr:putative hemogen [Triplophysa rosa]